MNLTTILLIVLGYFIGSIPWALVIGKVFYHTDVRTLGSHNLGGSNVYRTLGKVPGISVMVLDALKCLVYMIVLHFVNQDAAMPLAGLAVCIGHCYPVFANFKGGKAVASSVGYVLAINLFIEKQLLIAWLIPMLVFLIILKFDGRMAVSSISVEALFSITAWITYTSKFNALLVTLLSVYVIYKHKANIQRIMNGTEAKLKAAKK